jgi:uncharacterized protein (DUF1015 family)
MMADIRPFRGWRYDPVLVGDARAMLAPPYDVIGGEEQEQLYAMSPYNVVRVELTRAETGDGPGDVGEAARHARARATLDAWMADGVLRQDAAPALYLYEQRYTHAGTPRSLRSLLALVRLAPWSAGEVLRHEHTMTGPKAERLGLLRATATNISPIWSLYEDRDGQVAAALGDTWRSEPATDVIDAGGIRHSLWLAQEPSVIAAARAALATQPLYIADGHHRYETALAYQAQMRAQYPRAEEQGADFVLMLLTEASAPALLVLPTYRLFHGLPEHRLIALPTLIERSFAVVDLALPADLEQLPALLDEQLLTRDGAPCGRRFVLLGPEERRLRLLTLTDETISAAAPTPALAALDVWLAHEAILRRLLGIGADELARQEHISYTRDAVDAARAVLSGGRQLALFLAHTPVAQLLGVARAGAVMPQKSTYFYPKPATGLVIRRIE